jgi:hypothetical protein
MSVKQIISNIKRALTPQFGWSNKELEEYVELLQEQNMDTKKISKEIVEDVCGNFDIERRDFLKEAADFMLSKGIDLETLTKDGGKLLEAIVDYSVERELVTWELYAKNANILKPLEELYRKEFPSPDGSYYLPDRGRFYKWIVKKITGIGKE